MVSQKKILNKILASTSPVESYIRRKDNARISRFIIKISDSDYTYYIKAKQISTEAEYPVRFDIISFKVK